MSSNSSSNIPKTMKRLIVTAPGPDVKACKIEIETVDVPEIGPGEVLVKMAAAPINPSDYGSWYRAKRSPDQYPFAIGNEGSGVVVALGGGLTTGFTCRVGTKVGVIGLKKKQGTYSEYVVAQAIGGIFPLPHTLQVQDAASFFVNPYTAVAILDTARQAGSKVLVHTAAASQLGQMMVKLANQQNNDMTIINVVRRDEQARLLQDIGAEHVIVTSNTEWKDELNKKIKELNCTVAFDAVAGDMTGDILDCMPDKGTVYVYGGLAGRVGNIDPMALIYKQKKVAGFLVSSWITNGGTFSMYWRMSKAGKLVNSGLQDGWSSTQFVDTTLEKAHDDIVKLLDSSATGKKLRIRFDAVE